MTHRAMWQLANWHVRMCASLVIASREHTQAATTSLKRIREGSSLAVHPPERSYEQVES